MFFLLTTQVVAIAKGGTTYFPGNEPPSIKNIFRFFANQMDTKPPKNVQNVWSLKSDFETRF